VQVLNEYYVTVTQKLNPGLTEKEAWKDVEDLFAWRPSAIDGKLMRQARTVRQHFPLSWWDALIVAAAQGCGCAYLLTEDLQDGQNFDGTRIVDPFAHQPDDLLAVN